MLVCAAAFRPRLSWGFDMGAAAGDCPGGAPPAPPGPAASGRPGGLAPAGVGAAPPCAPPPIIRCMTSGGTAIRHGGNYGEDGERRHLRRAGECPEPVGCLS